MVAFAKISLTQVFVAGENKMREHPFAWVLRRTIRVGDGDADSER
jgi:hypothetical protein